ncbi:MAG: HDIG domain-containing protein [Phycisphaerae bacterium]|nr:HDIG domain-containing protein [Phycisphaerae bacterium]NUQ45665.1 HDIG domain-containing protein [Phycisphaerae bacterium]
MVSQSRVRSVRRAAQSKPGLLARPRAWAQQSFGRGGWKSELVGLAFVAGVVAITLTETDRVPYLLEQRVDRPILARVAFSRINQAETDLQRQKARLTTPNYYRFNDTLSKWVQAELRNILTTVRAAETYEKFAAAGPNRWNIDEAVFAALGEFRDTEAADRFDALLAAVEEGLRHAALVRRPTESERGTSGDSAEYAVLIDGDHEQQAPKSRLWYVSNAQHVELVTDQVVAGADVAAPLRPLFRRVLIDAIDGDEATNRPPQGPYVFDRDRTQAELARADHLPPVEIRYEPGDVLISRGKIDAERLALLTAEHEQYLKVRATDPTLRGPWLRERTGRVSLAVLICAGLMVYAGLFQPRIIQIYTRGLALAMLFCGVLAVNRLGYAFASVSLSPLWSVTSVTAAAAILALAYNQRFALGAAGLLTLLSTIVMRESMELLMVQLSAAAAVVAQMSEVRTRLRLVQIGLFTGVVSATVAVAVGLMQLESTELVMRQAAVAGLAAVMGVLFVLVVLPLIERAFGIATALTLLEWADTSKPLLRQLIQKAPATWHHSHLLATMGEAAANEIGANGLLVRVGAMYHDIGKLNKPEYFVENQQARVNAHSKLSPTMSMLVILGHVKDGLALAREYGLPTILHRFIAEHHGTTVVRYFHHMAAQRHAARGGDPDDREVDETEFRYPGPKPLSRETAILMLCDGVEGAVRSLQDPTPGRIESVVHEMTMDRLMDGQFDDCDITLAELQRVEQSLVKSLCAIYHGRIAYPKVAAEPAKGAVAQPA